MKQKILLTILGVFICGTTWAQGGRYTTKYDEYFRKYSKHYFSVAFDWRWFKAQAIAESDLRETVVSWCKAKGIMQLLPSTFEELVKKYPELQNDIHDPRWNIAAGIRYDRELWNSWRAERPFEDRLSFTFGSYNAGFGTLLRAQDVCKKKGLNENYWQSIEKVAPEVPKWRHEETLGYVKKIKKFVDEVTPR
ncbi:MAG: transglycosylase SLT domain-containing protein [Candidatus Dadabacteria bacterium]|nr:transglycosylase SLT domain-containing protein [Candidatus Dadabacteria bacterium]NIQ16575.1 transglycosylase SLT domain-containing protein [Candidatus Dadabacteria bacterium]